MNVQKKQECIFCKIIAGAIPAEIIDQNDDVIVIKDIAPKAPIHYLIVPKKHIHNVTDLDGTDDRMSAALFKMAQQLASRQPKKGFRLVINNGVDVGQSVFHLHCHFLSGKSMTDL